MLALRGTMRITLTQDHLVVLMMLLIAKYYRLKLIFVKAQTLKNQGNGRITFIGNGIRG